ncbi:hypothetical protein D3C85_1795220 [compost metagenome]
MMPSAATPAIAVRDQAGMTEASLNLANAAGSPFSDLPVYFMALAIIVAISWRVIGLAGLKLPSV